MSHLCFRLPVPSRGRLLRDQRWSMATPRLPRLPKAQTSGKRNLRNSPGNTRKCKYLFDKHLWNWFSSFFRLAKQKVLQADFDKEVSSVKGQVDGLKSKNNVSRTTPISNYSFVCVAAIELYPWLIDFICSGSWNCFTFRTSEAKIEKPLRPSMIWSKNTSKF